MKLVLLILLSLAAVLSITLLVVYVAGSRLPREHRSVVSATFKAPPFVVWAALTDYAAMPAWWPSLKSVRTEKLPDGTELTWNTDRHRHEIPYRTAEARVNEKLVRVIASDQLPFGGTWTFLLSPAPNGGTQLTLTEDGIIHAPVFRAIATWFIGLDATQKDFLAAFEKHLANPSDHEKRLPSQRLRQPRQFQKFTTPAAGIVGDSRHRPRYHLIERGTAFVR